MFYLMYHKDGFIKKYPLEKPVVFIGRSPQCEIIIDETEVSRRHCQVELSGDHLVVTDLKSRNGTWVDGAVIKTSRIALNGAFGVGSVEFFFKRGDPREFRVSRELSGIITRFARAQRKSGGNVEETRDAEDRYDQALGGIIEQAFAHDDFSTFLHEIRNDLGSLIPSGSLSLVLPDQVLLLLHRLDLDEAALLEAIPNWNRKTEGKAKVSGMAIYYRIFTDAASPAKAGLVYVSEEKIQEMGLHPQLFNKLLGVIQFSLKLSEHLPLATSSEPPLFEGGGIVIVGKSPGLKEAVHLAKKIGPRDTFVLIMGESGTGKELFAKMIHCLSGRKKYVALNCAAIPAHLLESELFGYEPGAFTDARKRKTGRIEEASGGTLVLDEIGDMPLEVQAKLLRTIQERTVTRLGGNEEIGVDLRIISMTNQDLPRLVGEGKFRQDLFFRLRVHELTIPPLRTRREDIPALIVHFAKQCAEAVGVNPAGFSESAYECFLNYSWPGNVRELENEIARIIEIIDDGELISSHHILNSIAGSPRPAPPAVQGDAPSGLQAKKDQVEREEILRLLEENQGNKMRTSKLLAMSYQGFLKKLKRLKIN